MAEGKRTDKENTAINVRGLSKDFLLPHYKKSSVKSIFTSLFSRRDSSVEIQHALNNISFSIEKGDFFGIVGRNGSGKSTMLKLLAGIYQPTSGAVEVSGRLVPFIELGVGFNPELTGRENVYLNGALLNFSKTEIDSFYDEVVSFAELDQFMDKKLKNYSSGMQVRLAFSMAIQAKADILLIDEVLAVGDADFQRKCFKYFDQLKKNKATVVFVSHDMDAVRKYCTKAILLDGGKVAFSGLADKVAQEYTKLFTVGAKTDKVTKEEDTDSNSKRWGDGRAYFTDVKISSSAKEIKIIERIKAKEDVPRMIAGIRIRNAAGVGVLGTNTKLEKMAIHPLKKDRSIEIIWRFPNVFSDGHYIVDPALIYDDEITVADWWDEALTFEIKKSRQLPYSIDLDYEVETRSVK